MAPTPWLATYGGESLPALDASGLAARGAEAVQPGLAHVALPLLLSLGRTALHAGAVIVGEAAWALIGAKESGKSTLLYACHQAGATVLTDDVLVLDGLRAFAGPRCLDLRVPGPDAELVRDGRHRVTLPPAPSEAPLAGVVHLNWRDEPMPELLPMEPGERLARLADDSRGDAPWRGDLELLDVAALPGYDLRRSPQRQAEGAAAALLAALASRSGA